MFFTRTFFPALDFALSRQVAYVGTCTQGGVKVPTGGIPDYSSGEPASGFDLKTADPVKSRGRR